MEGWGERRLFHLQPSGHLAPQGGQGGGFRHQLAVSCLLLPEAWKKELKDLASRVVVLTKENELKNKEVSAEQRICLGRDEMDPSLCKEIPFRLVQPDQQKS